MASLRIVENDARSHKSRAATALPLPSFHSLNNSVVLIILNNTLALKSPFYKVYRRA